MSAIRWTAPARRDLNAHLEYLALRNPERALALEEEIREAIQRLAQFPYRGRMGRREGTRELVLTGWPYLVVYMVDETRVLILRVLHTSQQWPQR
jgi:toxin ParE1/3/4